MVDSEMLSEVSLGAITNDHRVGGLNNKRLFLTLPEPANPRSRCQHTQRLLRALSLVCIWLCICEVSLYFCIFTW